MKWFLKCIREYVNFNGRASRREYWNFILFAFIFMLVFQSLDMFLFWNGGSLAMALSPLSTLFSLFIFLPHLSVLVRRMHDTGRSGKIVMWFYITAFVWIVALIAAGVSAGLSALGGTDADFPEGFFVLLALGTLVLLGWSILFLVWLCMPGTPGENKYGPDPNSAVQQ